jgi:uncharacterized protein YyaL (SSP411 family)
MRIGPGFIVAAAFIGPGTITTCTLAGASFGVSLLWVLVFATTATVLLQLSLHTGERQLWDRAIASLSAMSGLMDRAPTAFAQWLQTAWWATGDARELAVIGDAASADTRALLAVADAQWRPELVVAAGTADDAEVVPLLAGRDRLDGRATAYLCRGFACQAPTTDPDELRRQLDEA